VPGVIVVWKCNVLGCSSPMVSAEAESAELATAILRERYPDWYHDGYETFCPVSVHLRAHRGEGPPKATASPSDFGHPGRAAKRREERKPKGPPGGGL
jgi:hypothetical protein